MFKAEIHKGKNAESIRIWHKDQLRLEVLTSQGAALNYLSLPNREEILVPVIAGYPDSGSPGPNEDPYRGVLLFPFPNRLKDGKFRYQGREFQFPVNEPERNNALHGFLYNQPFSILEINETLELASVRLGYEEVNVPAYYPFSYRLEIEYRITEREGLSVITQIINTGTGELPYGIGWHPYLGTGTQIDSWIIQFPEAFLQETDQRMIPTGREVKYRNFDSPQLLGPIRFDTGFRIPDAIDVFKIRILDPENQLKFHYWQQSDPDGFRCFQIYTPPGRTCMALEPMTCPANGFQTQQFQVLEAGATQVFSWGIS